MRPEPKLLKLDEAQHARGSTAWDQQLGSLWAAVLVDAKLHPDATVMELGPGHSAKLAYALRKSAFQGRLVLVDSNEAARRSAAATYRHLLPDVHLQVLAQSLGNIARPATGSVDFVVANHLLDDLFLHACLPSEASDALFDSMTPGAGCSLAFRQVWNRILRDQSAVDRTIERVLDDLEHLLSTVRPAWFLINHYPSWRQSACGLSAIHELSVRMIRQLALRFEHQPSVSVHESQRHGIFWLQVGLRPY